MIKIRQATKGLGYIEVPDEGAAVDLSFPTSKTRRGRWQGVNLVPTICTSNSIFYIRRNKDMSLKIKKLSPRECFRLQGMTREDCIKCEQIGISNTQLYKIAGNGLVSDLVGYITERLYQNQVDPTYITTDEKKQPTITAVPQSFSEAVQGTV